MAEVAEVLRIPRKLGNKATQIGLRPEPIEIAAPGVGRGQDATVTRVEHPGDRTRLRLDLSGQAIVTLTDPHRTLAPGDRLALRPGTPLDFDASGARVRS